MPARTIVLRITKYDFAMFTLVLPDHDRWDSWLDSMHEFDDARLQGFSTFGFGDMDLSNAQVFEQWLERESRQRVAGQDGFVPATVWWIVDDTHPTEVLGSIQLRHELNDLLLAEGGHIGYGVRPSARRKGAATAALRLALDKARNMGLGRVLVICDADNVASQKPILAAGGVLENTPGKIERYWIPLTNQWNPTSNE